MAQIESTELTAPTHRSAEDRAAAGRARPRGVAAPGARGLRAGRRTPGSRRRPRGTGHHRVSELIPIRYGRMLVSAFTFYRGGAALMAADLAADAADRPARAALRRRAPLELRRLRRAGPAARLQRQRLRRDAARAVRVGRQAARRELRGRRPRPRVRRQAAQGRSTGPWRARTARRCATSPGCATSTSGSPGSTWTSIARRMQGFADAKQLRRFDRNVAKAHSKDSLRAFGEADRRWSTASRASSPTTRSSRRSRI